MLDLGRPGKGADAHDAVSTIDKIGAEARDARLGPAARTPIGIHGVGIDVVHDGDCGPKAIAKNAVILTVAAMFEWCFAGSVR